MAKQTVLAKKRRGPAPTGKGEQIVVRMHPPQLAALDAWISDQSDPQPSRPEAIRRLLKHALPAEPRPPVCSAKRAERENYARQAAEKAVDKAMGAAPEKAKAEAKRRLTTKPGAAAQSEGWTRTKRVMATLPKGPQKRTKARAGARSIPVDKLNSSNDG